MNSICRVSLSLPGLGKTEAVKRPGDRLGDHGTIRKRLRRSRDPDVLTIETNMDSYQFAIGKKPFAARRSEWHLCLSELSEHLVVGCCE